MKKLIAPTNYTDSWQLAKESFHFLSQNKDLNFILFLSLLSVLTFVAFIMILFPDKAAFFHNVKSYGIVIVLYFLLSYVLFYLETAFTAIVLKRLSKSHASIFYGFSIANKRALSLLKWTLMANTIGLLAKVLEGPQNLVEKLLGYSTTFYWSIASYFVLPIFIMDNVGPLRAMQQSTEAVGHGWKNTISVKVLITIVFVFVLLIMSEFIGQPNMLHIVTLAAPFFLILYILGAALEATIVSALFINVVQQKEPKHFDTSVLGRAFIKEED